MVLGAALGALALDEAVGQEHLFFRVEQLLDGAADDLAVGFQLAVDVVGVMAVFFAIGAVIVVVADVKAGEVAQVLGVHAFDQRLGGDAVFLGLEHDRRAMGVIGADIMAVVAAHFLKAHPDVSLDMLDHMAKVDGAVCVGQGAGHKNLAFLGSHGIPNLVKSSKSPIVTS